MAEIKLIVGLCNPEDKYAPTRHNAGAWFVENLARKHGVSLREENKFFGKTGRALINGQEVRFLLPTTYMNLSGKAVRAMAKFYRILPEEILVAHDELDLPVGTAKLKLGGGHGGHNGLKDIISALGNNKNFHRLRIGIDHPQDRSQVTGYVLGKPSSAEQQKIDQAIDEAVFVLPKIYTDGIAKATTQLNSFKA